MLLDGVIEGDLIIKLVLFFLVFVKKPGFLVSTLWTFCFFLVPWIDYIMGKENLCNCHLELIMM